VPEHYSPLAGFVIAAVSAIAMPRLMERLKLPAVLGYIAAGVLIGPAMLGVVQKDGAVITWLAEIGKLLFMFFVGFEIDLALFHSTRSRAVVFGSLTFAIPLAAGILLGRAFGYSWVASLLIGSIIASHTLLAYPVLQRLGVLGNEAVSVTISGTIFTDIAAMLVLAVAISVHERGFTWSFLGTELVELAIFVPAILFGLSRLARKALVRFGQAPEARLSIVMIAVALAAEAGRLIQLEGIVGAFLAGISLKRTLRGRFAVEQLEVTAHALFIPAFFLTTGFLVDFAIVKKTVLSQPGLVLALVGATLGGKWLAARLTGLCFGYARAEALTMASLSFPQMAATLASAVVGYQAVNGKGERLLDAGFVNAVVLLVIVTCVVGPLLTERFAARLAERADASEL
jgi:Kef-type K+ transport system membrane component KefB